MAVSYGRMLLHDTMLKSDSYRTGTAESPMCECGGICTTHSFALWQICWSQVWDGRCNWRHNIHMQSPTVLACIKLPLLYRHRVTITFRRKTIYALKMLFSSISPKSAGNWFYRCCFTPLDVPASCFLPVTDSLWFNVLVLTEIYWFTLEGLYLVTTLCGVGSTRRRRRGKFVLITNRKSYMSFRLVPKSVTLNDLERPNGVIL